MAIKILTVEEAETTKERCKKYGEVCEVLVGKATNDYHCDNSGSFIPKGTKCAAVMVLPSKDHPNYEHQKSMLEDYVED